MWVDIFPHVQKTCFVGSVVKEGVRHTIINLSSGGGVKNIIPPSDEL
jgi:hypothetical protein